MSICTFLQEEGAEEEDEDILGDLPTPRYIRSGDIIVQRRHNSVIGNNVNELLKVRLWTLIWYDNITFGHTVLTIFVYVFSLHTNVFIRKGHVWEEAL